MFGSSSDDEDTSSKPSPHPVIRSLIAGLLERASPLTCTDLLTLSATTATTTTDTNNAHQPHQPKPPQPTTLCTASTLVATSLQKVTARIIRDDDWISPEMHELTSTVTQTAWTHIKVHPAFKEAFLLATIIHIGRHQTVKETTAAFHHLDRAFVLGGPKRELRAILRILSLEMSQQQQQDDEKKQKLTTTTIKDLGQENILLWEATSSDLNVILSWYNISSNQTRQILRSSSTATIEPRYFCQEYYKKEIPIVFENTLITKNWNAYHQWNNINYWIHHHGHRTIPVEVGRHGFKLKCANPKSASSSSSFVWREEWSTISDFIEQYILPSNKRVIQYFQTATMESERLPLSDPSTVCYLAQHTLINQMPSLQACFDSSLLEKICSECNHPSSSSSSSSSGNGVSRINCWFGTEGTVTPLHFDTYDNFLVQVVGYKYVRLYSRHETSKLYVNTTSSLSEDEQKKKERRTTGELKETVKQRNISPVNVEDVDEEKYPLFGTACYTETILKPGDTLFIPEGCWHYVRSLSCSFSINFWF